MKYDENKAKELAEKIIEAKAALSRYLGQCFPAGARCGVMLQSKQKTPTPAEIIGVSPTIYGGEVHVCSIPRNREAVSAPAAYRQSTFASDSRSTRAA